MLILCIVSFQLGRLAFIWFISSIAWFLLVVLCSVVSTSASDLTGMICHQNDLLTHSLTHHSSRAL